MTQRQLQVGDYLLLHFFGPRIVGGGGTTRAFYASTVNVARSKVIAVSVLSGQEDSGFELARRLTVGGNGIEARRMATAGSSYHFGQARGYSGSKLEIWRSCPLRVTN